jgi:peptidoglycan/LPS O-acetylase OafA/YrhL
MESIGTALGRHKGLGPGFDLLRIGLAVSVLWYHSFVITGIMEQLSNSVLWFYVYSVMPMFFALSGFLIAGSAERLSLKNFLINRGLRIVPALAVEIAISALLIGPLFTTMAMADYFANPEFWHYFTNIFGWIQYTLPGVFLDHHSAGVINQSLWTVPFEVGCYILISLVILFRLSGKPWLILAVAISMLVLPVLFQLAGLVNERGKTPYALLNYALFTRGSLLFPSFLLGAYFYYIRAKLPFSRMLALLCLGIASVIAIVGSHEWKSFYALNLVSVPLQVYLTAYIGCCTVPKIPFYSKGDYSYGIYLYGYPLQQVIFALLPSLPHWSLHFALSLALSTAAAVFSWHTIEKPILKMRKNFSFVARRIESSE